MFSYGLLHINVLVLAKHWRLIYISSSAAEKTLQKQWLIKIDGKRESGISKLPVQLDDDDDDE